MAFLEPKEPSSSCVTTYQPPSAVPVEFHTYKDSVMRPAGILLVPAMRSRDILHQAKRDHLDLRSDGSQDDQAGEVVRLSHSSAEAKSLKTRVKGTVILPLQ